MRDATRRKLLNWGLGLGFASLLTGLVGYDWRLGAVICGGMTVIGSLFGMSRKGGR